jgi:hypothetical protein
LVNPILELFERHFSFGAIAGKTTRHHIVRFVVARTIDPIYSVVNEISITKSTLSNEGRGRATVETITLEKQCNQIIWKIEFQITASSISDVGIDHLTTSRFSIRKGLMWFWIILRFLLKTTTALDLLTPVAS